MSANNLQPAPATASQQNSKTISDTPKRGSLSNRLQEIKASNQNRFDFVDQASREIAESFNASLAVLEFKEGGQTLNREYLKSGPGFDELLETASLLTIESQLEGESRGKFLGDENNPFMLMTCPLLDTTHQEARGALTLLVKIADRNIGQKLLNSLEITVKWMDTAVDEFEVMHQDSSDTKIKPSAALDAVGKGAKFENLTHLSMALANNYCEKLDCEKASIGLVTDDGLKIKLHAISGLDSFKENSPPVIEIVQAQEECYDHGDTICVQIDDSLQLDTTNRRFLIHEQIHQKSAGACIASIPLRGDQDEITGILTLQRRSDSPFSTNELSKIETSVSNFSSSVKLMKRADRSLKRHFLDEYLFNLPTVLKNSTLAMVAAVAILFLIFGWLPYRPTVPCVVQPQSVSRLVAPFDGVLESVAIVPGDTVKAGQTVLKFDTRQLELQQDTLKAQIKSNQVLRDVAIQERQTAEASILDAEIHGLELQLLSIEEHIARANMTSAVNGHVVRGDLRQDVGQTIVKGTALAEISPGDGMRIMLHIPESKATHISLGDTGYFAADSHPGDKRHFKIVCVTPSTKIVDGQNVIVAEAEVEGDAEWLRSGMKGYAQVNTGWSPVIWIVSHKFWNALRLGFWI